MLVRKEGGGGQPGSEEGGLWIECRISVFCFGPTSGISSKAGQGCTCSHLFILQSQGTVMVMGVP
jgi:hypothetical protein